MGTSIPASLTGGLMTCIGNKQRIVDDRREALPALQVHRVGYVTYRGGRQTLGRKVRNAEFIFVVDRRSGCRVAPVSGVLADVDRHVMPARVAHLESRRFNPVRLRRVLAVRDGLVELAPGCAPASARNRPFSGNDPAARAGG